jgi:hypothetical protein
MNLPAPGWLSIQFRINPARYHASKKKEFTKEFRLIYN